MVQLVNTFPSFYGTLKSPYPERRLKEPAPAHNLSRANLVTNVSVGVLPSHRHLGLTNTPFPSGFSTKILQAFLTHSVKFIVPLPTHIPCNFKV